MAQLNLKCSCCDRTRFMQHPRRGKQALAELMNHSGWTRTKEGRWLCDNEDCVAARAKDIIPIEELLSAEPNDGR